MIEPQSIPGESLEDRISEILGAPLARSRKLSGGMIGDVVQIDFDNHPSIVAKVGEPDSRLTLESNMLDHLRATETIPVPAILHAEDDLLLLELVSGSHIGPAAEADCSALLACLHGVTSEACGFGDQTLNGDVVLDSPWTSSWIEFFREHRLRFSLELAISRCKLSATMRSDLEHILDRCEHLLREPERPSLMHGDLWPGNVLAVGERVTGFIDPSTCYGDAELELAYIDAFESFGSTFWNTYTDARPIDPDFYRIRRHVYALYPLLMHIYYFGERFLPNVHATVATIKPCL